MQDDGKDLWLKARTIIPGGNQLLSKRSERFLPDLWPAYYTKAKGCEVWDMRGQHYYDFAQMGVGSCVLGYADEDVDGAVKDAIDNGSMCSLNAYEEVELAECLIGLHAWADMARFARTGGEACAIAVRIARCATGKTKVAFCGYHGWHDWYLAANLADSRNLDELLLPGLVPCGVPHELKGTAIPFHYNRLDELHRIIDVHGSDIGVIIMEPQRDMEPDRAFLHEVRRMASEIGAVLIFDEITSGFRMNLGGIHLNGDVEPDLAVFGKALGNGYAISAVLGRRGVMECAEGCFISSTFWTERIGFVAALATIEKMRRNAVQKRLVEYGEMINEGWKRLAEKHGIRVRIQGIPPLTHISFLHENPLEIQTLYTQEMLKRGFLLGSSVYTTFSYTDEIIQRFLDESAQVFGMIRAALDSGDLKKFLEGRVIDPGFRRLNR